MKTSAPLIPAERIERRILLLRGQKVLLDFQLAELYGVATKTLNQAVKRNAERFPEDFMFQLNEEEAELVLRSQIVTSSGGNWSQTVTSSIATSSKSKGTAPGMRSQIVTASEKRNVRFRPYAFTEQGVAMLSSVLRSPRAVQVNIAIMRTFVQLRLMLASHAGLARKLADLEQRYDAQFKAVFDAIRALMEPSPPARGEIGFHTTMIPRTAARGRRTTPNPA
jgi:hypothetical protein